MSFKKKLSIAVVFSTLLLNGFVNASEKCFDLNNDTYDLFSLFSGFESDTVELAKIFSNEKSNSYDASVNSDDIYFIKKTSKPKEKNDYNINVEKINKNSIDQEDAFEIKNSFLLKNLNDNMHNNINLIGVYPTKIGNNNEINLSSLYLQNVFGLNKKYLDDLNDIENKSDFLSDKSGSHQSKEINSKSKSKFSYLLEDLNLSNKQIALSEKIKFDKKLSNLRRKYEKWNKCKKFKVYFSIHSPNSSKKVKTEIYYYNVPKRFKNHVNKFTKNSGFMKYVGDHLGKFVSFANGINNKVNSEFTKPLNFSETLTFRMVIDGHQNCSVNYFTLKNRGKQRCHELDYSKYSEDDLADLCKYFVYCIPDDIIPDSVLE